MFVIVPLWLGLLRAASWLNLAPSAPPELPLHAPAKALAVQHELQMVAPMTEEMKEEYWRRKAEGGEDLARVPPPSKLPMALWWLFVFGPLLWAFYEVWSPLLSMRLSPTWAGAFLRHPQRPPRSGPGGLWSASASPIGTRSDAQSRPIFYSLPQRRCYARRGVDRPASRQAGLHSRFHVHSVQHGSAAMPVPSATCDQASALAP